MPIKKLREKNVTPGGTKRALEAGQTGRYRVLSVFAVVGVTLLSMGLALAGAGGSLRVILYLLMRNHTLDAKRVPVAVPAHEPMVHETMAQERSSVAA